MVIAPGRDGISCFVTLADGEFLPDRFNDERVLVFRYGDSTNRELLVIKPLGKLADESILRPPVDPMCNFGQDGGTSPLHQHPDGTWWWYEETWTLESGPYDSEAVGRGALEDYCKNVLAERKQAKEIEETDGN